MSTKTVKADRRPGGELGLSGLEHWSGLINEEFLRPLQGVMGRKVFREMANNDAVVGSMLFAIEMFLRPVEWKARPFDESLRARKDAEFVEEVLGDMSHSWSDFISEWMACPTYGFAPFEIVWKLRRGQKRDPERTSKYSDGRIGVAKLAIRHPDSLDRWRYDESERRLLGMVQRPAPTFREIFIPMEKLLLFTVLQRKGSPEGTSLLRRAYVAWYRKKRIEEIEAIGIERELAGLPMFTTPSHWWADDARASDKALLEEVKNMGRRIRADEQACVVLPAVYDAEGNQLLTFELVSTGGKRAIDTGPTKEYYSRQMAMSIMMDVFLMGHEKIGSFALADSKTNLFSTGLGALLDGIEDVLNKQFLPRLMRMNGRDASRPPRIEHGDIETPDLDVVGEYVARLAGANLSLFPTETGELERELLRIANLPEEAADEIVERMKQEKEERKEMQEQQAQQGMVDRGNAGAGPPQSAQSSSRPTAGQAQR